MSFGVLLFTIVIVPSSDKFKENDGYCSYNSQHPILNPSPKFIRLAVGVISFLPHLYLINNSPLPCHETVAV